MRELVLLILGLAAAIWFAVEMIWIFVADAKDPQRAPRGFEVKLNTGETPVPREQKETNHG